MRNQKRRKGNNKHRTNNKVRTQNVPAAYSKTTATTQANITISGREYLRNVQGDSANDLYTVCLSPVMMNLARLNSIGSNFEVYKWNKLIIEYVPSVGTNQAGNLAWAISQLPPEDTTFSGLNQCAESGMIPFWKPFRIAPRRLGGRKKIKENQDPTENFENTLTWVNTASDVSVYGYFWIEYSVTFERACAPIRVLNNSFVATTSITNGQTYLRSPDNVTYGGVYRVEEPNEVPSGVLVQSLADQSQAYSVTDYPFVNYNPGSDTTVSTIPTFHHTFMDAVKRVGGMILSSQLLPDAINMALNFLFGGQG